MCRNLSRQPKRIGRLGAIHLHKTPRLPCNRLSNALWGWPDSTEQFVLSGEVIDATPEPTDGSGLDQPRQGLVDSRPGSQGKPVFGRENVSASSGSKPLKDPVCDSHVALHLSEIIYHFSDRIKRYIGV
jgi:hypothetical protein